MQQPIDSSSDDDAVFETLGSSINEAFGEYEIEEDADEVEEDLYDNED